MKAWCARAMQAVLEMMTAADPSRSERLAGAGDRVRRRYEALVQYDAEGPFFIAPMRRNVFVRAG